MSIGEKIKKYRKLRKMTQSELGEAVGLTDSAIRNYEHDDRTPNDEQLSLIAKKLDVPDAVLQDYEVSSAREALEALFRLEDAFGMKPREDGTLSIDPNARGSQKLTQAIAAWKGVLDEVGRGEMLKDDYELWRASLRV